jgi:hypothetical protein
MVKELKNIEDEPTKETSREILTLFLILFPSLLIAGNYSPLGFAGNLFLKAALIFYQFVVLKRVLDEYYKYA